MTSNNLFYKYNVPVPRYTSYPTVPYWNSSPSSEFWLKSLKKSFQNTKLGWSLYIHIPYCETLCTFCGCNTIITRNHKKEEEYVRQVLKEWSNYLSQAPEIAEKPLRHLHLGGGTPTFLSAQNLDSLLRPILEKVQLGEDFEGSIEVDPRRTNREHLETLYKLGFRRISLGVQDFDHEIQRLVNRIQPYSMTKNLTEMAREIGYGSVNFDLIYGLPKHDPEKMKKTAELTVGLRPERLAFYSLAIVPWIKPAQRLFKDEDLPRGKEKRKLYEIGRDEFLKAGYKEIGLDHFALPEDNLAVADAEKRLHRNFMGYTDRRTDILLGLGVSSISETPECFHQNSKTYPDYAQKVEADQVPTLRGHVLTEDDRRQREQILDFMTTRSAKLRDKAQEDDLRQFLKPLIDDGLLVIENGVMSLTTKGEPFLRNACVGLDHRLRNEKPETKIFSEAM